LTTLLTASARLPSTLAHWNYDRLIHNGKIVGDYYSYIRQTTNANSPITDITSLDMRCNAGGASGKKTQTYTIKAGDEIGFTVNNVFGHPGPQQVYISKAPAAVSDYDGSGSWTKIYSLTTKAITDQGLQWAGDGMTSFRFTIPSSVPAGEYLVRAEGLALHGAGEKGGAQWYMGCAQIKITGSGTGVLSPSVKIPGLYKADEPGILINIYYPTPTSYKVPGPALWPAGTQE
ncbi:lytic polysaccharide monooxygenase, partial [Melanomma pulvis-pyrius CBS 109.77]